MNHQQWTRSGNPAVLLALVAALAGGCGGEDPADPDTGPDTNNTSTDECARNGGEAPVGACLVALHAGTYAVTPSAGTHTRGTVVIGADGAVDYDAGLDFAVADYEGVYDRLDCCQRISVEMTQRADNDTSLAPDARHRVDVFTADATPGSAVVRFEYYPNWPADDGKVELTVN